MIPYSSQKSILMRGLSLALATACAALATGCALHTSGTTLADGLKIGGTAMGGRQPVIGATVNLYATGNTGYGSAATLIGTATTNSAGQFSITRNASTCTDPQQFYIVASGGDPGSGANSASVMVEALGPCASITTSTSGLVINELTTVAAAYALQGFADTSINIGTSSTNPQGLTHAFANAATLVALNGVPNTTTPGGNGTVPTAVINTLGDILASCVNSTGPTSTNCTAVLLGAPTIVGAPAPTTVWQEALNIARYPAYQTAALYADVTASSAYQTTLSTQPNDFSIGIAYSAGFQVNGTTAATFPWDIKADAFDNIWVTGMGNAALVELSNVGTPLSPNGGWGNSTLQAATSRGLAFDTTANENVWAADSTGNIWKYTPGGTPTAPTAGTTTQISETTVVGPVGIGVDSNNNVWFGTYNGTASTSQGFGEVAFGTSTATLPANSAYSGTAVKGSYTLFVDAANGNHVYAGSQSGNSMYEYLSSSVAPTVAAVSSTSSSNPTNGIAVDKNANIWLVFTNSGTNGGSISKFTSGAALPAYTCKVTVTTGSGLYNPRGIVIDGNNRLFITSYTANPGIVEFDPSLGMGCGDANNDAGTFFTTAVGNGYQPVNSAGTSIMAISAARNETVDSSGALWTINGVATAGFQPVIEILGIAAPVNPVLAAGKYGVAP